MAQPNVIPLVKDWRFETQVGLIVGQKVFVDASANPSDSTITTLPYVGQSWDGSYTNVLCKKISEEYLAERPNCPKKYVCTYDSVPFSNYEYAGTPFNLPVEAQLSGNFDVYDNPVGKDGSWYWKKDGSFAANVRIPKMVFTETVVITRYIYGNDLSEYHQKALFVCLNKVNDAVFLGAASGTPNNNQVGGPWTPPNTNGFCKGTVLFTGADMVEQVSQSNQKKWEARLHFQIKCVGNDNGGAIDPMAADAQGWNYIYNINTGKYDKITLGQNTTVYQYQEANFDLLFNTSTPSWITPPPPLP